MLLDAQSGDLGEVPVRSGTGGVLVEHFDPAWIDNLRRRGHEIDVVRGYRHGPGIAHAIERMARGYRCGSDPRAEGGASGL